jgi:murein DD-endopeptidase MepM/ murein hydrolase activator NlpD
VKRQLCLFAALIAAILLSGCGPAVPTTATATSTPLPSATTTETPTETATPSATPEPITGVCSPLADHALTDLRKYLTQAFMPPQGENKEMGHHGVDFAYYRRDGVGEHINGTPIQSVLNGTMAGLGYNPVYGNYLIIETRGELLPPDLAALYAIEEGQSLYLLYEHMQDLAPFEIREPLDCRQVIGYVGGSGDPFFVSDPHLHLETRVGPSGIFVEPMSFYDTQATEEEKASYTLWRSSGTFILFDPMILLDYGAAHEVVNG